MVDKVHSFFVDHFFTEAQFETNHVVQKSANKY